MLRQVRQRLTYANVMATLAMFVALGGGAAWAANEWGSANIRDNTLESRDLKDNAGVRSGDVVNDTTAGGGLVGGDIRSNTLRGPDILESSLGKVPDADSLDGRDSTALGVTTKTNHQKTSECDARQTYTQCAPVTVWVPAGKRYEVTVFSSLAVAVQNAGGVRYCPSFDAGSGDFCMQGQGVPQSVSLAANYAESAASTGQILAEARTYTRKHTFSTFINPDVQQLIDSEELQANTTVIVRDASAPGPPID